MKGNYCPKFLMVISCTPIKFIHIIQDRKITFVVPTYARTNRPTRFFNIKCYLL